MSLLVLTGELYNAIYQKYGTASGGTPSAAADSLFPVVNAHSGIPAEIFRFGSSTTSPTVTYDLDRIETGDMETLGATGPLTGWTDASTGTGAISREAVIVNSGTYAAKFASGTGTAVMYKDFTFRAGQRVRLAASLRGDPITFCPSEVRVQNLQTGNYANSLGAWQAVPTDVISEPGGGAYDDFEIEFALESYATCRADTVVLRVSMGAFAATSSTVYADDVTLCPAVKFASVHGHNIDPGVTLAVRSSTDGFAGGGSDTLRATFSVIQPSFFTTFAESFDRYWRFAFTGTQSTRSGPIWIGEWVLGEHLSLATGPRLPMSVTYMDTQIRVPMRWGSQVYGLGQAEPRTFPFTLKATSLARRQEIFDEVFRRSRGGRPLVMVPHDANGHTDVICGRLSSDLPHEWEKHDIATLSGTVEELPFPYVTS